MSLFHSANDIPGYIFATLITQGGVMGYVRKGSLMSLIAGGSSGLLAAFGAYRVSQDPKDVYLSLAVCILLTLVMGSRFARGGKFMPAGLVTLLSAVMAARYGLRLQ